ncbi:MAG: hypothetical protein ABSG46_08625 [Candidatus Binataceae bacterium]|jgi:hypothetical protein
MIEAGVKLAEARRRLRESEDFAAQIRLGHELKEGAILTSVTDNPFEISCKCSRCGVILWFENRGAARWRLHEESRESGSKICRGRITIEVVDPSDRGEMPGTARRL